MSIRSRLSAKLPTLKPVEYVTQAEIDAAAHDGLILLFLICCDCAYGVFGGRIPFVTISARTALRVMQDQQALSACPIVLLALARALELVDPGHLQAAMVGDACRQIQGLRRVAPAVAAQIKVI